MATSNVSLKSLDVRDHPDALISVRRSFEMRGATVSDWAKKRGYQPQMVYRILNGELRCARGKAHLIAVDLGLKDGVHATQPAPAPAKIHHLNEAGK